jgi:hypothetical protein
MASNLVRNLNKIRAANTSSNPESSVFVFDYFAPDSAVGQNNQRPLVRVIGDSLQRTVDGDWMFKGVNLYRINERGKGISGAIRTYRLSRINGIVRQP